MTRRKFYTYREVKMTVEVKDSDTTGTKVVTLAYFFDAPPSTRPREPQQ